jgi:phosphoribosyl 1,2-cyclic phosphodiesterase
MKFSVLSSGSKANCTVLDCGSSIILIDCGLSCKQTEIRLAQIGISPDSISAIIVTHEHSDHIHGVPTFSKKYKIPVFANYKTGKQIPKTFHTENFINGQDFWISSTRIVPFSITHDAVDPVGFCIFENGYKFSIATDLGRATLLVSEHLKDSNAIVLESNHDQDLLRNCEYPWELKQRISSSYGHLSNDDAAMLLHDVYSHNLKHVVLGHLSESSNTPEVALKCHMNQFKVDNLRELQFSLQCGSIHAPTNLIHIEQNFSLKAVS